MGNSKLAIINGEIPDIIMHDRYAYISNFVNHSTDTLQQPLTELKIGQNLGIYNEVGKRRF